ncbi:hypothetical protein [Risungbinella massiliensis]|uniref:hypothetical protein n=1 Tax=Risungbinella massiliensis TaxID=1329796 RepID=UPI0005CC17D6|nr:hypothetical protein [Risungbinella massiliensis]
MMRMRLDGTYEEVASVIKEFRTTRSVNLYYEYDIDQFPSDRKGKVICYFQYEPPKRQTQRIQLTTLNGKSITLDLLDGRKTDMGNGTTIISGYSYDIFS